MIDFINRHRELLQKAWLDPEERRAEWHMLLTRSGLDRAVMRAQELETATYRRDVTHDRHQMQRAFWGDYRGQVDQLRESQAEERAALRAQRREQAADRTTTTAIRAERPDVALPASRQPDIATVTPKKARVMPPPVPGPTRPKDVPGGEAVTPPRPTETEAAKAARRALERMAAARTERLAAEARQRARQVSQSKDRGGRDQ